MAFGGLKKWLSDRAMGVRDVFDANTDRDYYKRAQNLTKMGYAPGQRVSYADYERQVKGNARPYNNIAGQFVGNTARFINTGIQAGLEVKDTAQLLGAQLRGDTTDWSNTNKRILERQQRAYQPNSGLLGVGTIYNSPEEFRTLGSKEVAKRVGLNTLGTASEVLPFARVARPVVIGGRTVGNTLRYGGKVIPAKAGIVGKAVNTANLAERGALGLGKRVGFNVGIDAATGAGESAARQYAQTGKIDPRQMGVEALMSSALGSTQIAASGLVGKRIAAARTRAADAKIKNSPLAAQYDAQKTILADMFEAQLRAKGKAKQQMKQMVIKQQAVVSDLSKQLQKAKNGNTGGAEIPNPFYKGDVPKLSKAKPKDLPKNPLVISGKNRNSKLLEGPANPSSHLPGGGGGAGFSTLKSNNIITNTNPNVKRTVQGAKAMSVEPKSAPVEKTALQDALEGKGTKIKQNQVTTRQLNPTERQVATNPRQSLNKPSLQTDKQSTLKVEPTKKPKLSQSKNTPDVGAKQLEELYNSSLKDKTKKATFEKLSREYLGDVEAAKITASKKALDFKKTHKLTDEENLATILHKDNPLSTNVNKKVQKATDDLKKTYDDLYTYFTKEKGIDMGYQHDYYPREYVNVKTGDQMSAAQYDLLQRGSGRTQGRVSDELADWKLKYTDPAEGLKSYYKNLEKAAAGRKYMQELEAEGLVIKASGEPVQGYRPIIAEGLQNSDGTIYYAKKEVADKLNTMFGSREATNIMEQALEKGEGVNSLWQSVVLSGGVPNTPLNAFGFMQVMKETMALHPVKAMKGLYGGMNKKFAQEYFERKAPTMAMMAKEGIGVRYSLDKGSLKGVGRIKDAFKNKGTGQAINQAWNEITNDATFSRFMPILMTEHFDNIYKHGIKKGLTPKQASKIAGESTKNFYGITDLYKTKIRPKAVDDAAGTFLFAPRFRESMLNFWGKNAKALGISDGKWNMLKPEYRDNAKFLVAAGLMFAAYDGLNKEMNGTHLWENPDGKKDKLLIPGGPDGKTLGIPFLPSIATVPRNAAMFGYNMLTGNFGEAGKNASSFLSMPVKTAGELLTNENYFGQPIVDKDADPLTRLTQGGSYVAKSTLQPWIREGLNVAGQGLPEGVKDALGVKKKSAAETISNALESPVRFYDPKYFRGGGDNFKTATQEEKNNKVTISGYQTKDPSAPNYLHPQDERKMLFERSLPQGLTQEEKDVLFRYDRLKNVGLDRYKNDFIGMYQYKLADLKRRVLSQSISAVEQYKEEKDISKMELAMPYGKDIYDMYGLNKYEIENIADEETYNKLLEYDWLLYTNGLISTPKLDENKGRAKSASSGGSSRKLSLSGISTAASTSPTPEANIKVAKAPNARLPVVGIRRIPKTVRIARK